MGERPDLLLTHELRARLAELADPVALLEEIFERAPVGLQIYARDGSCVLVNPAHTALFGAPVPPDFNIFTDNILIERGVTELVRRGFEGEHIQVPAIWYDVRELQNIAPEHTVGGRRIAVGAELVPLRDTTGRVSHVLFVFRDETTVVAAREQAEAAAREADRRAAQALFLAEASRLLESLDFERTLTEVARLATRRLADFCLVDLVGADGSIKRVAAEHADPSMQPLLDELRARFPPFPGSPQPAARVIASGQPELLPVVETTVLDQHVMTAEHRELMRRLGVRSHLAVPLQLGARILGAISLGYVGDRRYSLADVPLAEALASRAAVAIENAGLYRAAEAARAEAEAASRAKDEFLAMLGHELRNPLAPIVTALELTRQRDGASRERAIIERQVEHLRRLVDDLLDVSRITRGTLELDRRPLDLAEAVGDGIEAARPLIEQRRHALALDMRPGLTVYGDRVRIAQIVSNLLVNAARYTEPGGRITVTLARRDAEIVLRVHDTGVGIPADLLPRMFEIFERGARSVDRAAGGLGLGLAIVKSLAALHGGRVAARSEGPGRGSELEVVFPSLEARTPAPRARTRISSQPPPSASAQAGHILVVDDNTDAAELLAEALEARGFQCIVSNDPHDALALVRASQPRLAVVDIGLPGIDGYELARRMHAEPGCEALPVVALTGFGQAADRKRSEAAGLAEHLVKPIQLDVLVALLHRLLAARPS